MYCYTILYGPSWLLIEGSWLVCTSLADSLCTLSTIRGSEWIDFPPSVCQCIDDVTDRSHLGKEIDHFLRSTFCLFSQLPTFWCIVLVKRQRCQLTLSKAATAAYARSICTVVSFLVAWLLPVILLTKCRRSLLFNKLHVPEMKKQTVHWIYQNESWCGALWVHTSSLTESELRRMRR